MNKILICFGLRGLDLRNFVVQEPQQNETIMYYKSESFLILSVLNFCFRFNRRSFGNLIVIDVVQNGT